MLKIMRKLLLVFLLFLAPASAQTITIGVQPSVVSLDFFKTRDYTVELLFFNELGDTDAIYTLVPDSCLQSIITEYPKEVLVPRNTRRLVNPVKVNIKFRGDGIGNKTCYLLVFAMPVGVEPNGTTVIRQSVSIKFLIYSPGTTPPTTIPAPPRQTPTPPTPPTIPHLPAPTTTTIQPLPPSPPQPPETILTPTTTTTTTPSPPAKATNLILLGIAIVLLAVVTAVVVIYFKYFYTFI